MVVESGETTTHALARSKSAAARIVRSAVPGSGVRAYRVPMECKVRNAYTLEALHTSSIDAPSTSSGVPSCDPPSALMITELVLGASIDDVWSATKVYALRTLHSIGTRYARTPEPGTALRTILAAADLLRAKACVVVSPDSTTIEPDWLQRLVTPVYTDNFDPVSPIS